MSIRKAIAARKAQAQSVAAWSNINASALPSSYFLSGQHRAPLSSQNLFPGSQPVSYFN